MSSSEVRRKSERFEFTYVLGRIDRRVDMSRPVRGYRAEAWVDDKLVSTTVSDGSGRFMLEWRPNNSKVGESLVAVKVFSPLGGLVAERSVPTAALSSPEVLLVPAAVTPSSADVPQAAVKETSDRLVVVTRFTADGDEPVRVESSCAGVAGRANTGRGRTTTTQTGH